MQKRILYQGVGSPQSQGGCRNGQFIKTRWFLLLIACCALTASAQPTITSQPENQAVVLNQLAGFSVLAIGSEPLSYQWQKDGAPLPGATNDQIIFAHAQFADAGRYSVIVSNADGAVPSQDAVLTVTWPMPGDLDCSFVSGGSIDGAAGEGIVVAVALQPDGKLLIAGGFSTVHGAVRGRIARLHTDGSSDVAFMNGLAGADDWIDSIALQAEGKILIGGSFTTVNGVSRGGIARLNADGTLDAGFQEGLSGANAGVYSIALQSDGKILIAGDFTTVNGLPRNYFARLNSDGSLDDDFQNGLAGANGTIYSVAVQSDNKVLIGGTFTTLNGSSRNRIARLDTDGTLDPNFLSGLSGVDRYVSSIVVQPDETILIGGYFTTVNGVARRSIARLNADGSLDSTFFNGLFGPNDIVDSIALQTDGKVVIGGGFTFVNGVPINRFARLNADGTLDSDLQSGAGPDNSVAAIAVQSDGKTIIGGTFTKVHDIGRSRVARLNADGTLDSGFANGANGANGPGLQPAEGVNSVAVQSDGKILVGGYFTTVHGLARNNLARLTAEGRLDDFRRGVSGPNGAVHSISVQKNGQFIIGGEFTSVNGLSRGRITRLNYDGSVDVTNFFNGSPGANSAVYATAIQDDDKIILAGDFTAVNSINRARIARLNPDGALDLTFLNSLSGANSSIYAVALQSDSKVIVGGAFTNVNGISRNRIARLQLNGALDTTFLNGLSGANGYVSSLVVQSDGKILLAGNFSAVNGVNRNGIARLDSDGELDSGFQDGLSGANDAVESIVLERDGKIVIAGSFTAVNGVSCGRIARLNVEGTVDDTFGHPAVSAYGIRSLAVQADDNVVLGGNFTSVNGVPTGSIARLWANEMRDRIESISLNGGTATVSWFARPQRTYRLRYTPVLPAIEWIEMPGDIVGDGSLATKTDLLSGDPHRFYQLLLLP
jgi:uncharacterized delta-60 repeat protein